MVNVVSVILKHAVGAAPVDERVRRNPTLRRVSFVNGSLALVVWAGFLLASGYESHFNNMQKHWPVALTMVFGSLVGGGTSEGGGAIGFPVLTKVLSVPAGDARLFTFAVQSIGMTCASASILLCRIPVERRLLLWGAPPAIAAAVPATLISAHVGHPTYIRVAFTSLLTALAVALMIQARRERLPKWNGMVKWGRTEKLAVVVVGAAGGAVSGFAGVGENTLMFILMVLVFRVSETIATPTTVILMASVSVSAFLTNILLLDSFHGVTTEYWRAAAPICAIGAPLGAWACSFMQARTIRLILVALISVEFLSTLVIVKFTAGSAVFMVLTLTILTGICIYGSRVQRYALPNPSPD